MNKIYFPLILFWILLLYYSLCGVDLKYQKKKIIEKQWWENFSWLYVSYGLSLEYWIEHGATISAIDTLERYPNNEERPRQFNELKLGGLYHFNQQKTIGIYLQLPIAINTVLPYQDALLANQENKFTAQQTVIALGDSTLGLSWKFLPILTWIPYLKLPAVPLSQSRTASRIPGAPWSGFGVVSLGSALQLAFQNHYAYASLEWITFDPFADAKKAWVLPGDFRIYFQYVYTIKVNNKFNIKPGFYYTHSEYRWQGKILNTANQEIYYKQNNLNPGISFSYFISPQHEVAFNAYFSFYADKEVDKEAKANVRGVYLGLYSGWYF